MNLWKVIFKDLDLGTTDTHYYQVNYSCVRGKMSIFLSTYPNIQISTFINYDIRYMCTYIWKFMLIILIKKPLVLNLLLLSRRGQMEGFWSSRQGLVTKMRLFAFNNSLSSIFVSCAFLYAYYICMFYVIKMFLSN